MLCNYDEMNLDAYNELLTVGSEAMETITSNNEINKVEKEMFNRDTLIINIPDYPVAIYNILSRNNITKLGQVIDLINSGELINLHRMGKKRAEDTIKITNSLPIEGFEPVATEEPECTEEVVTTIEEPKHVEEIDITKVDLTNEENLKSIFAIKRTYKKEMKHEVVLNDDGYWQRGRTSSRTVPDWCEIICVANVSLGFIARASKDPSVIFVRIPFEY